MILLDGKKAFDFFIEKIQYETDLIKKNINESPCLCTILVGNNYSSKLYVNKKNSICSKIGFKTHFIHYNNDISEKLLINTIKKINLNKNIDGILVQMPLPNSINTNNIILSIDPNKDVDGFHPENLGKMALGIESYISATPKGILLLLEYFNITIKNKHCVIIGRSNIVGKPLSMLLSSNNDNFGNATVTLVHSYTQNIETYTRIADVIIIAVGIPYFLKANMIKKNAIIIDVGINKIFCKKTNTYKVIGDVDFNDVKEKSSYISPVPGGVGPMTIIGLLYNTLISFKKKIKYGKTL
ncbi:MAG: bifunctional 5,10-methylenetetrahydrofolate dehydrogenase/5,10-methenyltetrahydrofolate cyclohydrolase [Bacteroides sp.]|nr:MAG: bifunctional 5,10-methylenetetrahydrofolate dehydrogenase/5,10-methenyltetrahydrofolate cyclohydrolase [Bacteroides sp.]